MHNFKLIRLALLLLTFFTATSLFAQEEFLRPDEAFQISGRAEDQKTIQVQWKIADNYFMYRDKFRFRSDTAGIEVREPALPKSETKHDEFFGEVQIYRNKVVATLPITRTNTSEDTLTLVTKSQGCSEAGLCYPPHTQKILLKLPEVVANATAKPSPDKPNILLAKAASAQPVANTQDAFGQSADAFSGLGGSDANDDILPAEKAFKFNASVKSAKELLLHWDIAPGTYLYQEQLRIGLKQTDGVSLGDYRLPEPKIKQNTIRVDGTVGDVAVYVDMIDLLVPLNRTNTDATKITLSVSYQGCAEIGICYPPQKQTIDLDLPAAASADVAAQTVAAPQATAQTASSEPVSEQDQIANMLKSGNTWLVIASFFGIGLLLAFTPCVFPMIPILSGIIAGQGSSITTRKAFMLSLIYVLAMAVTYTIAGVLAGMFGENLQAAFQNAWILGGFALVFVLLALSMFGFYELQLPSSLQSKLGEVSNKQKGGTYTGVAVMGFLSALIVGPCVAPPLAGALIYIGQTGDAVLGGLALFAMSMGMGAPLIAIGTGAGKLLPRAGGWMNAVKAVFGVMMLGVAILLLERIIPATVAMYLWAILLITSGIYMGALEQISEAASGWRKLWKGMGLIAVVYGVLILIGASAGGNDIFQPLKGVGGSGGHASAEQAHLQFKSIKTVDDLNKVVADASQQGKPVMLDFYADWCTYCIQFEKYVFTDAKVQASLANAVLIQADVTANDEQDKALLSHLGIIAPPAILFWDKTGTEKNNYRVMGYMNADEFNTHVQKAIQ